jgi:hypothetical protein
LAEQLQLFYALLISFQLWFSLNVTHIIALGV